MSTHAETTPQSEALTVQSPDHIVPRSANSRTRKSVAQLEAAVEHYPEKIRTETIWLQGFLLDHCKNNIDQLRSIAAKHGTDRSREYFSNLVDGHQFTNKPSSWKPDGEAWNSFLELMAQLRRYEIRVKHSGQMEFVQTPTYLCISNFITAKRAHGEVCKFGGIVGPTGSQKSESFRFYRALNNHGAVEHVEAPANGKLGTLQEKIARAYHSTGNQILRRREACVRENVNETRCMILDNVQDMYDPRAGSRQPCFNWLRELQDDTRCTIILSFTDDFLKQDLTGGVAKGYFEQFLGRMGGLRDMLKLPQFTPASDIRVIARAFGLDAKKAIELLTNWSQEPGRIRIVFKRLQLARSFARLDERDRITIADLEEAASYQPPAVGSDGEGGES
jgi:hypothetical protein